MKKILIFIHIERAGGTSLHHLLHYNFKNYITISPKNLYTNKKEAFFEPIHVEKLLTKYTKLDGFGGHTIRSFLKYDEVLKFPVFYLTFLRDPVTRYMSHFNYQRNVMNINWNLEDFISTSYFNNFQCKRIIDQENPERAFQELKKYSFVGITEFYNESLLMLKYKIDWLDFNPLYEKKNKIPSNKKNLKFDELPIRIQDKIIKNNLLDQELYNNTLQNIFNKQRLKYSVKLNAELTNFENKLEVFKYPIRKILFSKGKKIFFRYFVEPKLYA